MDRLQLFTPLESRIDAWAQARIEAATVRDAGRFSHAAIEFVTFGLKQAWACTFGATMLAVLIAARVFYPADAALARTDALVIAAVAIQVLMLVFRLEAGRELWVIMLFHVVGTVMEVFKTQMGSWSYDDGGVLRIATVPLYSGFMYAAVGSYMVRVYRLFDLRFVRYPPLWATALLAIAIYANFFTHHWVADARWVLIGVTIALFARCSMYYRNRHDTPWRRMPILVAFTGVAVFIWLAENIATAAGAWVYPNQTDGWHPVSWAKLTSWFLLMLVSVVLVTFVYPPRPPDGWDDEVTPAGEPDPRTLGAKHLA